MNEEEQSRLRDRLNQLANAHNEMAIEGAEITASLNGREVLGLNPLPMTVHTTGQEWARSPRRSGITQEMMRSIEHAIADSYETERRREARREEEEWQMALLQQQFWNEQQRTGRHVSPRMRNVTLGDMLRGDYKQSVSYKGEKMPRFYTKSQSELTDQVRRVMREMGMKGLSQTRLRESVIEMEKDIGSSIIRVTIEWDEEIAEQMDGYYSLIWTNSRVFRFLYIDALTHNLYMFSEGEGVAVLPLETVEERMELPPQGMSRMRKTYVEVDSNVVMESHIFVDKNEMSFEFQSILSLGFKQIVNGKKLEKRFFKQLPKEML